MDPKKLNRIMGPMGAVLRDQQLQLPVSLLNGSGAAADCTLLSLTGNRSTKKKKIERHRFAEPSDNPRALHN